MELQTVPWSPDFGQESDLESTKYEPCVGFRAVRIGPTLFPDWRS